ncbi:MAG: hypothetical protein AAFY02_00085 [Pseudomonadota bacterium]
MRSMPYLFSVKGPAPAGSWPWPLSAAEAQRLRKRLLAMITPALAETAVSLGLPKPQDQSEAFDSFLEGYRSRPLVENRHGSGFNDSLWLWLLARWLNPALIVESGTFLGHSAWLFRRACPAARIVTHDVEIWPAGRLRAPGVDYRLDDWQASTDLKPRDVGTDKALCFFDDHLSHLQRLREAAARGFRWALFDDNFPAWQLHATGAPPLPSLAMLLDDDRVTHDIDWQRKGKQYRYSPTYHSAEDWVATKALVVASATLPDLAAVTRLPPGSNLTLVRLRTEE